MPRNERSEPARLPARRGRGRGHARPRRLRRALAGAVVPEHPLQRRAADASARSVRCSPTTISRADSPRPTFRRSSAPTAARRPTIRPIVAMAAERLRRLAAEGRRAGRDAGRVLARRSARHAVAHPDHPPRLRRGLELHRQVEGRAARARARAGEAQAGGALHRLPLRRRAGEDARRLGPSTTRASTSTTLSTRRRSSPTR